jgi:hypothetical protein
MKLLTGLFRFARKRVQTTDNDMGMFREKLTELVEKKAELPDEEVAKRVDELKEMTVDLPDEEGKAKLDRFLEDFKSVKEQDDATAKEAASMVSDLFEKLDTEAMKDVPEAGEEPAAEETTEEAVEETATEEAPLTESAAPEAETEEATEAVEETVAPEEEAKDADPNPEYTLEEIYQFVKKRMAEDSCAGDSAEEVEETKEEKEDEEEVTTDHAPRIPVTMNGTPAAKGSLADMFNTLKEGGR